MPVVDDVEVVRLLRRGVVDLSSGPKAESPGQGQRHETRARGDDDGRGTETGDSGPISYSGGAFLLLNAGVQRKRKRREAQGKGRCIIRNCGEESKQASKQEKVLFTEIDVGRVQTGYIQNGGRNL